MHNQYPVGLNTVWAVPTEVNQPLAHRRCSPQIYGVTRADIRTLAWLAPLAAALVFWWLFRADPCLDNEIGSRLRDMHAPEVGASVVIDNPYGILTCDYWPDATDHVITWGLIGVIALLIGFLSARNFQQRARTRAALIAFSALALAGTSSVLAYLPRLDFEQWGYGPLLFQVLVLLAVAAGAAMLAWFAAMFTLRLQPGD